MPISKDPKDSPLNNFIENPVTIGVLMVVALLGAAFGFLESWYALVLIAVGAFGIFRVVKKRKEGGK